MEAGAVGSLKSPSGFTIVEVLTVTGILAILAAIALPGFMVWLPTYRLNSATRDLRSNFQLAKISAIKNRVNCAIVFNQSVGGTTYDYVVFLDADGDMEFDSTEQVITRVLLNDYGGNVAFNTSQGGGDGVSFQDNDNGNPAVAFLPTGVTRRNDGSTESGSVFLRSTTNNRTTSVSVSVAGSITIN